MTVSTTPVGIPRSDLDVFTDAAVVGANGARSKILKRCVRPGRRRSGSAPSESSPVSWLPNV